MEAADLKVKLNRASEGIADLEQLLAKLNPESWLFREVRRKIEDVFLRTDDQDGLAKYYAAWLDEESRKTSRRWPASPGCSRGRLACPRRRSGSTRPSSSPRRARSCGWRSSSSSSMTSVMPRPSQQYAALDKADPNNPDYLRDWGKLVLRDTSRPKDERQDGGRENLAAAGRGPADRSADRHAGRRPVPPRRDARRRRWSCTKRRSSWRRPRRSIASIWASIYHILKRPDEALATWRKMAEGNQRTATNLARLAEVLAQFGYMKEALPEIAAACELDPKDFSLQLKAADLQIRGEQYDAALASLARAEKLAQNDEEREAVLSQQIKTHMLQNKLADLAAELTQKTASGERDASPIGSCWPAIARRCTSIPKRPRRSTRRCKLEPNHIRSLAAAARIAEQAGDLQDGRRSQPQAGRRRSPRPHGVSGARGRRWKRSLAASTRRWPPAAS